MTAKKATNCALWGELDPHNESIEGLKPVRMETIYFQKGCWETAGLVETVEIAFAG